MSAAIYVRTNQDNPELVAPALNTLQQYSRNQNLTVVKEYVEINVSGLTHFSERPVGAQLLSDARAHSFDLLLISDFTRLSRDLLKAMQAVDELHDLGVSIRIVDADGEALCL